MQRTETVNTFEGHIVRLHDLDSGDEINIEVLINDRITPHEAAQEAAEKAALKSDVATLSGNTFEAEYQEPSGKVVRVTKIREVLQETSPAALEMLEDHKMG